MYKEEEQGGQRLPSSFPLPTAAVLRPPHLILSNQIRSLLAAYEKRQPYQLYPPSTILDSPASHSINGTRQPTYARLTSSIIIWFTGHRSYTFLRTTQAAPSCYIVNSGFDIAHDLTHCNLYRNLTLYFRYGHSTACHSKRKNDYFGS